MSDVWVGIHIAELSHQGTGWCVPVSVPGVSAAVCASIYGEGSPAS